MTLPNNIKLEAEHVQAIEELAENIDCPVEEVSRVYVKALESLKTSARIRDYLIVLAGKKVRDELRH